jgi:hypothetical protein
MAIEGILDLCVTQILSDQPLYKYSFSLLDILVMCENDKKSSIQLIAIAS